MRDVCADFYNAFQELGAGRFFVETHKLRQRLGLARSEFDGLIRMLRNAKVIQLHTGDCTLCTPADVDDWFMDENGFRHGSITLRRGFYHCHIMREGD